MREKHLNDVLVNFSYDKKDLPLTTCSFTIVSDVIEIVLSKQNSSNILILDSAFLQWKPSKLMDRFVKQMLSIRHVFITKDEHSQDCGFENLLQPSRENLFDTSTDSQLSYSSHTRPDGNNVRC